MVSDVEWKIRESDMRALVSKSFALLALAAAKAPEFLDELEKHEEEVCNLKRAAWMELEVKKL